jgi:hypothetical protein
MPPAGARLHAKKGEGKTKVRKTLIAAALAAIGAVSHALADELAWCGNIDSPKDCRHAVPAPAAGNGSKHITIADFLLDGKELAEANQSVSLTGTYIHEGSIDWLYPAGTWARNRDESNGVPLIKDGATREFRLVLMNTWNRTNTELGAEGFTVLGHVSMCERTTLVGVEKMPCLIIEDGNNQAGVEAAQKRTAEADEFMRKASAEAQPEEDKRAEWQRNAMRFSAQAAASQQARDAAASAAAHAAVQKMHDDHSGPWCRLHPDQGCR